MFNSVKEFHEKFNKVYNEGPRYLPADLEDFRIIFMQEELDEYKKANMLEDKLDALVDLVYVALGTAYAHGFDFDEAFRRVHFANMKKCLVNNGKRGFPQYDVGKPEGWTPPDLSDLCVNQLKLEF